MDYKIPKNKPSRLLVAAISLSMVFHLVLIVALQMTPVEDKTHHGKYDYLSSAVFEVFGPTGVIWIYDVTWPGTLRAGDQPVCQDPELAVEGLCRPPDARM